MKKQRLLILAIGLSFLVLPKTNFCQTNGTLNLGILSTFEAFTGTGGISNGVDATFNGDVGTQVGIISGFSGSPNFTGNTYNASAITAQCKFDVFRVYIHLNDLFVTHPNTHPAAFGGGETITPGVYSRDGAGSLGGTITLDGGGNPNAFFVLKFYGAFTVGAGAVVNLTNGTKACNVFWIAQGAISVAANANVKGTLFAKIGAITVGADAVLQGRMLSIEGAITTGAGSNVTPPPGISTIPIFCETNCSPAAAVDVLGSLSTFALYTNLGAVANTGASGIDGNLGTQGGDISGYNNTSVIIGSFNNSNVVTAQANIDIDNAYTALMAIPNTATHTPAYGSGEILHAGVYHIAGAGSLAGTIFLDGQNNPNAIFVFKFAGAFSIGAQSKVILVNGARRCNIFWIGGAGVPTGAITMGAGAELKGTFLSHGGACNSGANVFLGGRQLSTGGAVNTYTGIIYNNPVCVTSTPLLPPGILAIADTTAAINGLTGGNTPSLTLNDILNGAPVVIGTAPGNVALTGVTVPDGLTLNPNGTVTIASNTPSGNYPLTYKICEVSTPANCSSVTSMIVVSAPVIVAVADTTAPINGSTGGTSTPLTSNDKLNGIAVVIGTAPGNVILTGVTIPAGLTLNPNGTVTVAANTPAGNYPLTYKICEVTNPTNCSTATSIIVVSAPTIIAIADTTAAIMGTTGGTTTPLTSNDVLDGTPVVIGTAPGDITLTGVTVPAGFTLNPNGTVTIAAHTPAGNYPLTYRICEVSNPSNCSSITSIIVVSAPVIIAVADTTTPINGSTGGTTIPLTSNDKLNGIAVVVGTAPGNVILTGVTIPAGLTLNPNGTVTVAANTPAGSYFLTYKICEVTNPTNCSTVTSKIVVSAPAAAPDLTINTTVFPNIMHGTTPFRVTIMISEMWGNPTDSSVILVRVPRDPRISFTFDPTATQIGFTTVNNSIWAYDGTDAFFHLFRTSAIMAGSSASVFGYNATFTPGQSSGKYTLTASVHSGSGGETFTQNNNDAETVDYFIN